MLVYAGYLPHPTVQLAAHGALSQVYTYVWQFWTATSIAASVRIGNLIGANEPQNIFRATISSLAFALFLALFSCYWLRYFADSIIGIYTENDHVKEIVYECWPGLFYSFIAYSLANTTSGLLRGAGMQKVSAYALGFGYWIIGLPYGYYFGVVMGGGLVQVWYGNVLALVVSFVLMIVQFARTDFCLLCEYRILEEKSNVRGSVNSI